MIVSRKDATWKHPNGWTMAPFFFHKAKDVLTEACPDTECQFHVASRYTPYFGLLQKAERAAWAERDGIVTKTFADHSPMLGNL